MPWDGDGGTLCFYLIMKACVLFIFKNKLRGREKEERERKGHQGGGRQSDIVKWEKKLQRYHLAPQTYHQCPSYITAQGASSKQQTFDRHHFV